MGGFLGSQVVGVALFLTYLIFRKRRSTQNKYKLHTLMLLAGGYGLASLVGGAIIGLNFLLRLLLDGLANMLAGWLPSYLGFIPTVVRFIPDAVPYMLLFAIPLIVLLELWPHKWAPRFMQSHFSTSEDTHTPKFAFLVPGIFAQAPFAAGLFGLSALIQAVSH